MFKPTTRIYNEHIETQHYESEHYYLAVMLNMESGQVVTAEISPKFDANVPTIEIEIIGVNVTLYVKVAGAQGGFITESELQAQISKLEVVKGYLAAIKQVLKVADRYNQLNFIEA